MTLDSKFNKNAEYCNRGSKVYGTLTLPDGGTRAWLVVLGSYLALFSTFGIVNSFGIYQKYYQTVMFKETSASVISLIGAIQLFLLYGLGPVVGRIFDAYGTNLLIPVGSLVTIFSMMVTSICQPNHLYQIVLSQGILFGIGNALIFTPALAVIGHWFHHRRTFALGIVASGSSLGGVVYPILFQRSLVSLGFGWAVRVTGFVTLACLFVSILTLRTRLPLQHNILLSSAVDFGGFRDRRYSLASIAAFLLFYTLFIPYDYIGGYAGYYGVPQSLSEYLLAILNSCGILARMVPGKLADRIGLLNILVVTTLTSAALILGLWLPSRGAASITIFSALYGLFSGTFMSLLPAYIATISPPDKYGARLGTMYLVVAIATLVGAPSAGAFLQAVSQQSYEKLIIFTGVLVACGGMPLIILRCMHSTRFLVKV